MNNSQLINQTSGDVEYYTPREIIDAARKTMGHIDLDPACSLDAFMHHNHCPRHFTEYGLEMDWSGNVWMNHPFNRGENACTRNCKKKTCRPESKDNPNGRGYHISENIPGNDEWINKLIIGYTIGNVTQACCITFACTSERWFQPLFAFPMCFLYPRTNYFLPDGTLKTGVTKGSVVTYLGGNVARFCRNFSGMGNIVLPWRSD